MQRGHLVAYDEQGTAWPLAGEAMGDILPHALPVGALKVIELPYGALDGVSRFIIENGALKVLERFEVAKTPEQLQNEILDLKAQLLIESGVI